MQPTSLQVPSLRRGERHKEIICYANRIFMSFFLRISVIFYCASLKARAKDCFATVLLRNSIGHVQGLDKGFGCLNVLSPLPYS